MTDVTLRPGSFASHPASETLRDRLTSGGDPARLTAALEEVCNRPAPDHTDAVEQLTGHDDAVVRRAAYLTLWSLHGLEARYVLLRGLMDGAPDLVLQLIDTLASAGCEHPLWELRLRQLAGEAPWEPGVASPPAPNATVAERARALLGS